MARQVKRRPFDITFTTHSWERLNERGEELPKINHKELKRKIHGRLNDQLGKGLKCDGLFVKLEIFDDFYAVLMVNDVGFAVITYIWGKHKVDTREEVG